MHRLPYEEWLLISEQAFWISKKHIIMQGRSVIHPVSRDSTFKQLTVEIRETLVCLNWLAVAKVLQFGETVLGSADSGITRGFPLVKSTCHAGNICKPCLEQDVTSLRTAVSRAAYYNDLLVFWQLIDPIR